MKNWLKTIIWALILASCTGTGYDAQNTREMKNDFTGYASFAWLPKDSASIANVLYDNAILGEKIVETVNEELKEKGYTVSTGSPDILLQYTLVVKEKDQLISTPSVSPYYYHYYYHSGYYYIPPYNPYSYYHNYPGYVYDQGFFSNNYPYYTPYGFPDYYAPPPAGNHIQEIEYEEGTLIIDAIDRKQGKLVWRGWSTEALPGPEIYREVLPAVVKDIFETFPKAGNTFRDLRYE